MGELLDEFELLWSDQRQSIAQAHSIDDMRQQLSALFANIEKTKWNPFLQKCEQKGWPKVDAPAHFAAYAKRLIEKPATKLQATRLHTDIVNAYDAANDGSSVVYNSLFQDTRSLLTFNRKWFANTRTWLHDSKSAILFADTRAILSGERELFANTRATLARILLYFNFPALADVIMPNYSERFIDVAESLKPTKL